MALTYSKGRRSVSSAIVSEEGELIQVVDYPLDNHKKDTKWADDARDNKISLISVLGNDLQAIGLKKKV